jgi:hypothetical protein
MKNKLVMDREMVRVLIRIAIIVAGIILLTFGIAYSGSLNLNIKPNTIIAINSSSNIIAIKITNWSINVTNDAAVSNGTFNFSSNLTIDAVKLPNIIVFKNITSNSINYQVLYTNDSKLTYHIPSFPKVNIVKNITSNLNKTINITNTEFNYTYKIIPPKIPTIHSTFTINNCNQIINSSLFENISVYVNPTSLCINKDINVTAGYNYSNSDLNFTLRTLYPKYNVNMTLYPNQEYTQSRANITIHGANITKIFGNKTYINDLINYNQTQLRILYAKDYGNVSCSIYNTTNNFTYCSSNVDALFYGSLIATGNTTFGFNKVIDYAVSLKNKVQNLSSALNRSILNNSILASQNRSAHDLIDSAINVTNSEDAIISSQQNEGIEALIGFFLLITYLDYRKKRNLLAE